MWNFQESQRSKPFQAKVIGESQFYAEVKSQGKTLALTAVAGGSMEDCVSLEIMNCIYSANLITFVFALYFGDVEKISLCGVAI